MKGLPVTVRLLDPPLHEFVPTEAKAQKEVAKEIGVSPKKRRPRTTSTAASKS